MVKKGLEASFNYIKEWPRDTKISLHGIDLLSIMLSRVEREIKVKLLLGYVWIVPNSGCG